MNIHEHLTPIEIAVRTAVQCWGMVIGILGIATHRVTLGIQRAGKR